MPRKKKNIKEYIVDTNVFLHDPGAIYNFGDNNVVIPITVVEEIDRKKKDLLTEVGRNARILSRIIDGLRNGTSLAKGVKTPGGGTVRIEMYEESLLKKMPPNLYSDSADNRILAVAATVKENYPDRQVVIVTKDTNVRIKADIMGIKAEDYKTDKVDMETLYTGEVTVELEPATIDQFHRNKAWTPTFSMEPNQFITMVDMTNPSHTALGRFDAAKGQVVPLLQAAYEGAWDLKPLNREQIFALDLLLNEDIKIVTLVGKAGTGKTLSAIAAGLSQTADFENQTYQTLLVGRPVVAMGKDLGFLPGDINEKLAPWMQPIFDNLEFLLSNDELKGKREEPRQKRGGETGRQPQHQGPQGTKPHETLMAMGILKVEALTYIRGRSIPNQFIVIDEAQNLTPHEVKTIATRAGKGTKIILTGDPYQIDNPFVDASSNGLSYAVEKLKFSTVSGHVTLTKGERSELAELCSNAL